MSVLRLDCERGEIKPSNRGQEKTSCTVTLGLLVGRNPEQSTQKRFKLRNETGNSGDQFVAKDEL